MESQSKKMKLTTETTDIIESTIKLKADEKRLIGDIIKIKNIEVLELLKKIIDVQIKDLIYEKENENKVNLERIKKVYEQSKELYEIYCAKECNKFPNANAEVQISSEIFNNEDVQHSIEISNAEVQHSIEITREEVKNSGENFNIAEVQHPINAILKLEKEIQEEKRKVNRCF